MKRLALLLTVFIVLLAGCSGAQPGFFQPDLNANESALLSLVDRGQTYLWDFVPPEGAKYLRCEVEYYKNGVQEVAVDKHSYAFSISGNRGRLLVDIAPTTNTQYRSSLGSVDFFDNPVLSSWTLRLSDRRNEEEKTFFTGYDFSNIYRSVTNYKTSLYHWQDISPLELDQSAVLFCFALSQDDIVAELANQEQLMEQLKDYPYAYVFQCTFTAN